MDLISGQHIPLDIYKTPKQSRQHLTIFNLLLVSKAVKREITTTFRRRCTFTFQTSRKLLRLLAYGSSSWGGSKLSLTQNRNLIYAPRPKLLFKMGHVTVFPNGPVSETSRCMDNSFINTRFGARIRKMYPHPAHPPGWKSLDPSARRLLKYIQKAPLKLRSLEMSAILVFNARAVRQLRRLRGVDLHFAFIPGEATKLPIRVPATKGVEHPVERLAETADTKIVLPIYRTELDIEPVSVAPLSCLIIAIRREVASSEDVPRVVHFGENQGDPPLWIDFDDESIATANDIIAKYTMGSLSQPTSGWYRYSARNPGVACLEMADGPLSGEPLERRMLRRQRKEWGRRTWNDRRFGQWELRSKNLDEPRALRIYHLGLKDIVVAHR
ncbi:hypothetical protein TrVFT333_011449 [Trichoderma virens FT-333]|nr:hypothetical protein TrVFT333_011449 [Trichoderma virens FT-333]